MAKDTTKKDSQKNIKNALNGSKAIQVQNPKNVFGLYTSEFSFLDPTLIHRYNEQSRKGMNFFPALLFSELMQRDLTISASAQTRKLALAGFDYEISGDNQEYEDFIKEVFSNIPVHEKISEMVESVFHGVSIFELNFVPDGSRIFLECTDYVQPYTYLFNDITGEYGILDPEKADAMQLRMRDYGFQDRIKVDDLMIPDIHPMKMLEVHCLDGNHKSGFLNGSRQVLTWAFALKSFGIKDWGAFLEVFGTPAVVGKYASLMQDKDKAEFQKMVQDMGNMLRCVIPDGASIEVVSDTGKANSAGVYESYVNYLDNAMNIRILGQNLTQNIRPNSGSRAAAEVHNAVRMDLLKADALMVKRAMNEIIRRLMEVNYPSAQKKDYPCFEFADIIDWSALKDVSETLKNMHEIGYEPKSIEELEEKFGMKFVKIEPPKQAPGFSERNSKDWIDKLMSEE